MVLFFPSTMDSLYYESNGGSGLHGFCVFLEFLTGYSMLCYGFLYDYYGMLAFLREVMGVIDCKVCALGIGLK
jgi:hypothetical protein